jgi:hypothetical protein
VRSKWDDEAERGRKAGRKKERKGRKNKIRNLKSDDFALLRSSEILLLSGRKLHVVLKTEETPLLFNSFLSVSYYNYSAFAHFCSFISKTV